MLSTILYSYVRPIYNVGCSPLENFTVCGSVIEAFAPAVNLNEYSVQ